MSFPHNSLDEQGNLVDWSELIETEANELTQARQRITELEVALQQFANNAEALIDNPCEVNWTALQYNIIEARRLL